MLPALILENKRGDGWLVLDRSLDHQGPPVPIPGQRKQLPKASVLYLARDSRERGQATVDCGTSRSLGARELGTFCAETHIE